MISKYSAPIAALFLVLLTGPLTAADPWDAAPFSADSKAIAEAAAKLPSPDDAPYEFLLNESTFTYDDLGRCRSSFRLVYRILNEQGIQGASFVEAAWAPWHQERVILRARAISPDGAEHKLDAKHVAEVPADQSGAVLTDRRRLRAPLAGVRVGSVVEREFLLQDSRPFFDQGTIQRVNWIVGVPQRLVRLVIDAPAKFPLRYEARGVKLEPRRTESEGRVKLVFESGPHEPLEPQEGLQPPQTPVVPHLVFSTGSSWAEIAKAYSAVVEKQLADADIKPAIADLLAKPEPREKMAGKLLARLHEVVQYTGLLFGEAAIVPRTPTETLGRRFGDCKDQSTLLVAMLRAAGVEAHVALLHSGVKEEIPTDLPGLGSFNHAIVYLPGEPPLWIDPTTPFARVGELPQADQGQPALIASAATTGLVRTPQAKSGDNRFRETQAVDLSNPSAAKVRYLLEFSGTMEQERRAAISQQTRKAMRKEWDDFFKRDYLAKSLDVFNCTEARDLASPCRIEAEAAGANFGAAEAGTVQCVIRPGSFFERLPPMLGPLVVPPGTEIDSEVKRKTPLVLWENFSSELVFRYVPPAGFSAGNLPESKELKIGPATVSRSFQSAADNVVTARFNLDTGHGRFTPEEVDQFRAGLAEIGTVGAGAPWEFILTFELAAARHSLSGRHREAFAEFRRLLTQQPDSTVVRLQYATALLRAGFGQAARAEARRVVESDPRSTIAWHQLGLILTHDTAGRHFQPGLDWEGAAAAYRKGLELDPNHELLNFNYAILLERDASGQRLGKDVKLDEPLAVYKKAVAQYPANQLLRFNYLLALFDAERFGEVLKESPKLPQPLATVGLKVAALAAENGTAAARQHVESVERNPDLRRNLQLVTGDYLQRVRRYAPAVEFWEAGAAGAPNEAQVRRLIGLAAKSKRYEEVLLPTEDPAHVVQRLYLKVLLGGREMSEVRQLFANPPPEGEPLESVEALLRQIEPSLRMLRRPDVSPARRGDVVVHLTLNKDGDDALGFRIRARHDGIYPRTWFVVKREGGYKLWDVGPDNCELGVAALKALDEGQPDVAKTYLAWAYDELRAEVKFFDVYAGTAFARLWGIVDAASVDDLRLASAALMCTSRQHEQAVKLLLAAREAQTSDARKLQIDRALMAAGGRAKKLEIAIEAADHILATSPRAHEPFARKAFASVELGRKDEALALVRKQHQEFPEDTGAKYLLGILLARNGEFAESAKLLRPVEAGRNVNGLANELAWNALFQEPIPETALADAKRATERDAHPDVLHTLACVQAEIGQAAEAHQTLLRVIDARQRTDSVDNLVLGRLAEHYELPTIARNLYEQVAKDPAREAGTSWHLAQRHLKRLAGKLPPLTPPE